jgi:hypothetical protein
MNEQELRTKWAPRVLESQIEFDRVMNDINNEQTMMCGPLLDRQRELNIQQMMLENQRRELGIKMDELKIECHEIEGERKALCRAYHEIKHGFIVLNPKERFAKEDREGDGVMGTI